MSEESRPTPEIIRDLAPTGTLRAAINLGNPVLTHGTPEDPGGVTVAIARELGARLGVPVGSSSASMPHASPSPPSPRAERT